MLVPSFKNYAFNPLATSEAQDNFKAYQAQRFGIEPNVIQSVSFSNGDFIIYIRTEKKSIIDLIINKVYGTNPKKYLGLNLVHYFGETSIIVK